HPPLPPERVDLGRVVGAGSLGEEELSVDGHPPTSEQGVDPAPDRRSELQGSDRLYQYTAVGPQHLWKAIDDAEGKGDAVSAAHVAFGIPPQPPSDQVRSPGDVVDDHV